MSKLAAAEKIYFADREALRTWFLKNHAKVESFWLVYDKVKEGKRHLTYDDIVEESLCFGFIDSQPRKVSEAQASYYISRRKAKSEWSKRNKEKVAALTKKKLMHASGLAAVTRAKEDGSWSKIDASENHVMPGDFAKILEKQASLRKHFDSLAPSMRKAFLHRLQSAKTPETRKKRLDFLVQLLTVKIRPSEYRAAFTKGVIPQRRKKPVRTAMSLRGRAIVPRARSASAPNNITPICQSSAGQHTGHWNAPAFAVSATSRIGAKPSYWRSMAWDQPPSPGFRKRSKKTDFR